ncbi:MAG: DUF748 domain-containing protein [Lentimicrobium sp.]|nr:DUF748 domain-containing protein [Lentimicrobium sp.]MDD4597627.1 DUF748 domain-containing protein [Lentimicrobiaceae bacterium]
MSTQKKIYKRKGFIILLIVVMLLIAFRLYLPTLVKNYVNKVLSDIPGYYGHVEDIDLAIYRGAYVINGLYLNKVKAETQIPFLNFPKTDISIQWNAIFRGKIVSEIYMYDPEINYVMEDQQGSGDTTKPDAGDWTEALDDLIPIDINHLEITNGTLAFKEVTVQPPIDLSICRFNLTADNLRMVKGKEHTLPSPISATGTSIGGGQLSIDGKVNLIREIPDTDISFTLEKVDITALNPFAQQYAKIDFKQGEFNFFSEVAIADGYLKGYLKPLMTNVELVEPEEPFLSKLWEGFVEFFGFIVKNQRTKTLATKVPLEGDLNNPDTEIWPAISAIFRNAWIEAFKRTIDDEIDYEDAMVKKKGQEK